MSIAAPAVSLTAIPTTRTTVINLWSPYGQPYHFEIRREVRMLDGSGKDVAPSKPAPTLSGPLTAVAAMSFTAGGITATGAQIAQLLSAAADAIEASPPTGVLVGRLEGPPTWVGGP